MSNNAEKIRMVVIRRRAERKTPLSLLCLLFFITFMVGCSTFGVPQWSGSGFLSKEFLDYESIAILPFEGDDSGEVTDAFASNFHEKFQGILIVDRKQYLEVFRDQVFNPSRLDNKARRRIGKTLGVQALITGKIYYPSITRWFLQVVILDVETGKGMGHSMIEINFMGGLGKEEAVRFAVQKLISR